MVFRRTSVKLYKREGRGYENEKGVEEKREEEGKKNGGAEEGKTREREYWKEI